MLIVCTQDPIIRNTATSPVSGSGLWAPVYLLNPGGQPGATVQFRGFLRGLRMGEPLALSAHGNNTEIGDAGAQGWGWSVQNVAGMLLSDAPMNWLGPILIHACANNVANFSAGLAVALAGSRFAGMWCYGYNVPVPATAGFPNPATLAQQVDLQGSRV